MQKVQYFFSFIIYNNSHKRYKTFNVNENKFMIKGRKTTYNERIEIVAYYIKNNDNYQLTSDKYKVSYQQVYCWVRKYKTYEQDCLIDDRGKSKAFNEMRDSQRLMAQIIEINLNARPLFRSDRGFQYTSKAFKLTLDKVSATQSMSRVVICIDNKPIEGFW